MLASDSELQKNYKNAVFDALTQFQFIESLLKDCIFLSHQIVQVQTKETLDFTCSKKELNKKALQALCTKYRGLTKNKALVKRIKDKTENRNIIVHEACFQNWKDRITGIDNNELHTKSIEIQKHADEASKLVGELLKERNKLELKLKQLTSRS